MAKPKTLRERASDYACGLKAMTIAWRNGAEEGYIAGHRAGARLTKAERKVIEAAMNFVLGSNGKNSEALRYAVHELEAKKVRK